MLFKVKSVALMKVVTLRIEEDERCSAFVECDNCRVYSLPSSHEFFI